jgi:hypothetical protein
MPRIESLDDVRADIIRRWEIPRWDRLFPWWPTPVTVRILFYADGSIQYDGGPFYGLKQVLATLTADPYHWVRFEVTTVHRHTDPSADHDGLDLAAALQLGDFDELWIYSIQSGPALTAPELAAARHFMDVHNGGVLITGDHANLGMAFGNLPRAGKMRQLPAPPASPPSWNTTLRSGANPTFEFADQSDSTPQPLSLTWYWGGFLARRPHPLLCSPLGPIDIFPDHEHEGEAVAPAPVPTSEWPGGVAAEVIARGTIVDPSGDVGRQVGVLSAYDGHAASVGRIVADSTWHHHFDINLRGELGDPTRTGFVNPGTDAWLSSATKIEHYFLNAAIWLAPPARQASMRFAAWWASLWSAGLVQLGPRTPLTILGRTAYDALGRRAPQCVVFGWIWDLAPHAVQRSFMTLLNRPDPPPPFLDYLAGAATRDLMDRFDIGPNSAPPRRMPTEDDFREVLADAAQRALEALTNDRSAELEALRKLADSFQEPTR